MHSDLPDGGSTPHQTIDEQLPTGDEKAKLQTLAQNAPIDITGARDDTEAALANLLTALETLGLITDSTTAT